MDLVYLNVNDDGEPYGQHDNLDDALQALVEFPEDHIVVAHRDSFVARGLLGELRADNVS